MIQLAVFDIDGTLLGATHKQLHPSTIQALNKLKENGVKIAIASGRTYPALDRTIVSSIDFDYFICCNGNSVYHKDKLIFQNKMSVSDLEKLTAEIKSDDGFIIFHFDGCTAIYHDGLNKSEKYHGFPQSGGLAKDCSTQCDYHLQKDAIQAVIHIKDEWLNKYKKLFPDYNFVAFGDGGYDVDLKGISKLSGIEKVCESLGCSLENVISFGDHMNDYEMISKCKIGVAMGDGLEGVKQIANFVTKISDENAIEYACMHFNLI